MVERYEAIADASKKKEEQKRALDELSSSPSLTEVYG
jgi:hypothetical protein